MIASPLTPHASPMRLESRIYVAGHRGLAGSAIVRKLQKKGYHNLLVRTHAELDLTDQQSVRVFFEHEKPDYVFLAAARLGGKAVLYMIRASRMARSRSSLT